MSFSRQASAVVAGLVLGMAAGSGHAVELQSVEIAGQIAALGPAKGVAQGIPTGEETDTLVVRTGDGDSFQIGFADGQLTLAPWSGPVADAPARADMLPDGEETRGRQDIARAFLIEPTRRYPHGILGDDTEAGGLRVVTAGDERFDYRLEPDSVFEDRRARLVDLDDDGNDEVVVVRSYLNTGAAISVFGLAGNALVLVDEAPAIGRSSRWLNPAGAADFDGDGLIEIAYVETPHIGGTLKLLEYDDGNLRQDHDAFGFSNHAIGSREQDLAAVVDWDDDGVMDLVLPDARRTSLKVVTFSGGTFAELASVNLTGPITTGIFALPGTDKATVVYGVGRSSLVALRP